jgi:lysophospholipase L1-like esterase
MTKVLFTAVSFGLCIISLTAPRAYSASETEPVRILCVGDSITRGTLLGRYESGPYKGQGIGLPNPHGGGYRKYLQDMLRAAGIRYEFVGQLTFGAYGKDGVVDPDFSPHHQGLPGWGNRDIMLGYNQNKENTPPTVKDVLDSQGGQATVIKDIATVLHEYHPDVVLLMSGSNGHNAKARDELIEKVVENFKGPLLVATIPPQKAPRVGWEKTAEYNASLPETINRLKADGAQLQMVDVFHAVQESEITDDGVHPNAEGQKAIATAFFSALEPTLRNLQLNK